MGRERLERVVPLARTATDASGRSWTLASVEVWSGYVRVHVHAEVPGQPTSHEDVMALSLSWRVVAGGGEVRSSCVTGGWCEGVWSVAFTVRTSDAVTEVRAYDDDLPALTLPVG